MQGVKLLEDVGDVLLQVGGEEVGGGGGGELRMRGGATVAVDVPEAPGNGRVEEPAWLLGVVGDCPATQGDLRRGGGGDCWQGAA